MDWTALIAILISLLLIGFFAGIEIAFVSANKLSIELNRKQGTRSGQIWGAFSDRPARFIGTTLVGINIVFVIYGLLATAFRTAMLESPRVQAWLRRSFAAAFAGLAVNLAFSER